MTQFISPATKPFPLSGRAPFPISSRKRPVMCFFAHEFLCSLLRKAEDTGKILSLGMNVLFLGVVKQVQNAYACLWFLATVGPIFFRRTHQAFQKAAVTAFFGGVLVGCLHDPWPISPSLSFLNCSLNSSSVFIPLRRLHTLQLGARLAGQLVPLRESGIRCSIITVSGVKSVPHK